MLIICNKAGKYDYCSACTHGQPHEKITEYFEDPVGLICTIWGICYPEEGLPRCAAIKVRCIKVKPEEKTGD